MLHPLPIQEHGIPLISLITFSVLYQSFVVFSIEVFQLLC